MIEDLYTGFQVETLDNGLSVCCTQWPGASWLYVGVVVHAGAREDPTGRQGLAHQVLHQVGENVPGLTFAQLKRRVRELGGRGWFGTTSYLATTYSFQVPAEEAAVGQALSLFGQMLLEGRLSQRIQEEKAVMVREYHSSYEHEHARAWALRGRPYLFANHPRLRCYESALGVLDEMLSCRAQELQAFSDTFYVPGNMSLVCIGSMSRDRVRRLLEQSAFSQPKAGQRTGIPKAFCPRPPHKHEESVDRSAVSPIPHAAATICWQWVLPFAFSRWAVHLFAQLVEDRLLEELRSERSLTYEVEVEVDEYQECRTLSVECEIPPSAVERAKGLLWQVLGSIPRSEEDFLRTKQERIHALWRLDYSGFDLLQAAMSDLERYQRLISFSQEFREVEQVTFEQIVALAEYLTPERQFCFILLP